MAIETTFGTKSSGHVALVVVVDLERPVEPALTRADRRLRLDHDERDAVDEQHEVGALLGRAGAEGELRRDDVLVLLEVGEVDQADGDVLAVLAERHRPLAGEPGGELLVRLDEAVGADAHHDRAELVEDVVGAVGLGGDLRVQPDQRLAKVILDQDLVRLAREVLPREEVPAETGELPVLTGEARTDGGVVRDAAAEAVADEGFDGVGFVEASSLHADMQSLDSAIVQQLVAASSRSRAASLRALSRSLSCSSDCRRCSSSGGSGIASSRSRRRSRCASCALVPCQRLNLLRCRRASREAQPGSDAVRARRRVALRTVDQRSVDRDIEPSSSQRSSPIVRRAERRVTSRSIAVAVASTRIDLLADDYARTSVEIDRRLDVA